MSMSVSDLAPFVAAVLRDRVVDDLREENESLRAEIQRLRTEGPTLKIAITGPGGAPVYATTTILHRELLCSDGGGGTEDDQDEFIVNFAHGATACRRDSLRGCRLVLTPEAGVGQEHVYNIFENELQNSELNKHDQYDDVLYCNVHLADLGVLDLQVPLPTGHDYFDEKDSCTLAEVEANADPGAPIVFENLISDPATLTGRVGGH